MVNKEKLENAELFEKFKSSLMNYDPATFCEKYLTLDGKPFRLIGNGYRPFVDIYRHIGIKALEKVSKPVIIVKGRQTSGTTMAMSLEMYFMGCGLFGTGNNPPIRIIHAFPQLEMAAVYSKTKLNPMINSSWMDPEDLKAGKNVKIKSYMQKLLDQTSATNDSLSFKQFVNGNHLWIDSTGIDADRLRGRSADAIFFDECFPFNQYIETINGKEKIGKLYNDFIKNKELPLVKTFNEITEIFEYKKIINAWKRDKRSLIEISCSNRIIRCTPNHKFLTEEGWLQADQLKIGTPIKISNSNNFYIRALNDDQLQIVLGSFLGDGHLSSHKLGRFRLKVIHGEKQREYCEWKASMFGCDIEYLEHNGYSKKPAVRFCTKLFGLNEKFPETKTTCPQWVLDKLDARGIAIWIMDDGSTSIRKNGASLCLSTCSFDEDSQIRIVEKFKLLGIDCHYAFYKSKNKDKGYFSIYFNSIATEKLLKLISPYIHNNISYKIPSSYMGKISTYKWNNIYKSYGLDIVDKIIKLEDKKYVYDIEVEDNHNFIASSSRKSRGLGGLIAHNCQDTPGIAISNAVKILSKAQYGSIGNGIQVYFGTPKKKGSDFYKMWESSSQQYYYLGCEKCKDFFPLYTPGSDDWEKIWLYEFIVKCTHCNHEQDKRLAVERGKWIGAKDENECAMVGFHINQLYIPEFTKEKIMSEKPGTHPVNTERTYQNEVLGEFFQGDSSPITPEEIRDKCGDIGRKMRSIIVPGEETIVTLGIDYGAKSDLEQLANPNRSKSQGQSYSTAVILTVKGPNLLSIDFATKFKRNDSESKKGIIDNIMRQYSVNLAVGDIGFSQDFSTDLHYAYGDRYLVSRAQNKINNKIRFAPDALPKEIQFERDFYIGELFELMKKGQIKFPMGDYEKIAWLIQHCSSMDIKPSISKYGDPTIHYVKGGSPNDGFMALLNAYIAYKYIITNGFTNNNPLLQQQDLKNRNRPLIVSGVITRKF